MSSLERDKGGALQEHHPQPQPEHDTILEKSAAVEILGEAEATRKCVRSLHDHFAQLEAELTQGPRGSFKLQAAGAIRSFSDLGALRHFAASIGIVPRGTGDSEADHDA